MRALAAYGRYSIQVQRQIDEAYATGMTHTIQRSLIAEFFPGGMLPQERELAISQFAFPGFNQMVDEVGIVPPDGRIGCFDSRQSQISDGWTDEERELVEAVVTRKATETPSSLVVVPEYRTPAPWPRYDEFSGDTMALVRRILEDGYEIEPILAYESENQNRPELVAAFEQLLADSRASMEEIIG